MDKSDSDIPKLYYSIGEVSQQTGLDAHVLRYWETEFRELSPRKNRGGKRLYRDSDIELLLRIKELLYEKRFTIEGARKALHEPIPEIRNIPAFPTPTPKQATVDDVRRGLLELKALLGLG